MKKYKITFKHLVENEYEAFVEAETQEEAKRMFDESPFDFVEGEAIDEQGLDIKIQEVKLIK